MKTREEFIGELTAKDVATWLSHNRDRVAVEGWQEPPRFVYLMRDDAILVTMSERDRTE